MPYKEWPVPVKLVSPSPLIHLKEFQKKAIETLTVAEALNSLTIECLESPPEITPIQPNQSFDDFITNNVSDTHELPSFEPEKLEAFYQQYRPEQKRFIPQKAIERNLPFESVDSHDLILTIAVFHPKHPQSRLAEFQILASQPLTVLRDAFYCQSDFLTLHPNPIPVNSKSQKLSSSYLFIENVFYNDMRSPLAMDYSQPIIQWVMQDGRHEENGLAQYSSKLMHQVQWLDLSLRLNYPYLLTHQGDCTHTFSIRSIRLIRSSDEQDKNAYPLLLHQARSIPHRCVLCQIYMAKWVTYNDIYAPQNPCFWCSDCFEQFHVAKDGNYVYTQFEKYPYELREE